MKIGFDIGGVISKYPHQMWDIIDRFRYTLHRTCDGDWEDNIKDIYIITDMHPKDKVCQTLIDNGFYSTYKSAGLREQTKTEFHDQYYKGIIHPDNIYCADYEKYGNMAKAVLIKQLGLDVFVDDFDGYLQWDSWLGPQPLLLKVMPDAFKPYWHDDWKCDGGEFGRRKAPHFTELGSGI